MDLSQEVLSIHNNSFSVNSSFEGADVYDLDDRQSYIELEHSVETATADCSHDDVRQYHNMDRGSNIEENAESVAGMHEDVFQTQDDQESYPGSKSSKNVSNLSSKLTQCNYLVLASVNAQQLSMATEER